MVFQILWTMVPDKCQSHKNYSTTATPTQGGKVLLESEKPRMDDAAKQILLQNCKLADDFFSGIRIYMSMTKIF